MDNHYKFLNQGLLAADMNKSVDRWFVEDCIAEAIEVLASEVI